MELLPVSGFHSTTGKGVLGVVAGKLVAAGNEASFRELSGIRVAKDSSCHALPTSSVYAICRIGR